jgi:hypothetical protein
MIGCGTRWSLLYTLRNNYTQLELVSVRTQHNAGLGY